MVSLKEKGPIGQTSEILFPKERLKEIIEGSVETILQEQHPVTGLFPAATAERHVANGHYHDAWVRDNAMVGDVLLAPVVRSVYPKGTELGDKIYSSALRLVGGMLDLFGNEPWNSAFEQKVREVTDGHGRAYKKLDYLAPPIHFKIDGESCNWPTQNQPDSWGEFLTIAAGALRNNELFLDPKQQATVDKITQYLGGIDLPNFEHFSMWEWGEIHHPASLSTLALVANGLFGINPFISERLKKANIRVVHRLEEEVRRLYPEDYTVTNDHKGKSDMATLVAANAGALNGVFLSRYFNIAHPELGNGQYPGKKRYLGDLYYRGNDGEAIWPMGALIEADIFFKKAIAIREQNPSSWMVEKFKQIGLKSLQNVQRLIDVLGYSPELLQNEKEGLIPNGNHLLWNEALMVQACSRALILV